MSFSPSMLRPATVRPVGVAVPQNENYEHAAAHTPVPLPVPVHAAASAYVLRATNFDVSSQAVWHFGCMAHWRAAWRTDFWILLPLSASASLLVLLGCAMYLWGLRDLTGRERAVLTHAAGSWFRIRHPAPSVTFVGFFLPVLHCVALCQVTHTPQAHTHAHTHAYTITHTHTHARTRTHSECVSMSASSLSSLVTGVWRMLGNHNPSFRWSMPWCAGALVKMYMSTELFVH